MTRLFLVFSAWLFTLSSSVQADWPECVLRLFETEPSTTLKFDLDELQDGVSTSAISNDRSWVAIGSELGVVRAWHIPSSPSPIPLSFKDLPREKVIAIAFQGLQIQALFANGVIAHWSPRNDNKLTISTLALPAGLRIQAGVYLRTGVLVTAMNDGSLHGYDATTLKPRWTQTEIHNSPFLGVSPVTTSRFGIGVSSFVAKSANGKVSVHRGSDGKLISTTLLEEKFLSAQSDGVSTHIGTLTADGRVIVYRYPGGQPVMRIQNHDRALRFTSVALSRRGDMLFTANQLGFGQVWNLKTGKLLADLGGENRHFRSIERAFFTLEDDVLITVTNRPESTVKIWDPKSPRRSDSSIIEFNPISGGRQMSLTRRNRDGVIDTQIHTQSNGF